MLPLNTTRENKLHWAQEPQLKVAKGCQPVTATQDDALLYSFLLPWMRKQLGGKSPLKTTKVKDSVRNLLLKKCDQFRTGNKYLPFLKIPQLCFLNPHGMNAIQYQSRYEALLFSSLSTTHSNQEKKSKCKWRMERLGIKGHTEASWTSKGQQQDHNPKQAT